MLNASKQQAVGKPKGKQVVVPPPPTAARTKAGSAGPGSSEVPTALCRSVFPKVGGEGPLVRGSLLRHAVGIPALQPRRLPGAARCCSVPAFPSPGRAASWQPA